MNKLNLVSALMVMVFLCALLSPMAMAQANEKAGSVSFGLNSTDRKEIEKMTYSMLELQGIQIENLDLSQIRIMENETDFILTGKITYDVSGQSLKSSSNEREISSHFSRTDKSATVISTSADETYEMNLFMTSESLTSVEYKMEEIITKNGQTQKNVETFSQPKITSSSPAFGAKATKYDLPTKAPSGSIKIYNDASLYYLLAGTSLAVSVAASAAATGGTATGITATVVLWIAELLFDEFMYRLVGVSTRDVYIDFFFTIYPRIGYNSSPAWGFAHPTVPLYGEIDYYYK
ncbi:hypothetical protein [Methanolapillus ohkumae]|uniref:Uncharacterized protein n=1 Tax=Methanolapillus ohkumae TaxID=3028298 RepID=A0AA97A6U1_9EURY|nr:hypothetical protein MsAm2_14410 [Methanosarcinaceae archaeon Am2]